MRHATAAAQRPGGRMTKPSQSPNLRLVNGTPVVSSLTLAEHFRKRHDDVLKAIRNLIRGLPENFNARNFAAVEYLDPKGEKRPAFNLTRDGFTLLAMGFSGAKALAWKVRYIQAFNTMEDRLREKGKSTLLPRQNEGIERKKQILFTYKEWKPMTKDKIDGIMGWIDYWCYIDNIEKQDAIQQLCIVLQIENLTELQDSHTTCIYNFIWWSFFAIRSKEGQPLSEKQIFAFNGLIEFWNNCLGENYHNIISFICTKNNIRSLEDIKQHSIQKAFNSVLLGIFRHIFCNQPNSVHDL